MVLFDLPMSLSRLVSKLSCSTKRPKLTPGHKSWRTSYVVGRLIGVVGLKLGRANLMSGMSELNSFLFHRCRGLTVTTCPGNRMALGLSFVPVMCSAAH